MTYRYRPATEPCGFRCNARKEGLRHHRSGSDYFCRDQCLKPYTSRHICRCQEHDSPEYGDTN